ncbi:hypothetical protein KKG46_03470 [Patescibacteria group bacterium]|nr:hypothetical protein [Patescibacteria group bacterium]
MKERTKYEKFTDLPSGVQNFFSEQADPFYDGLIKDYKLPQDKFFDVVETPVLKMVMGYANVEEGLQFLDKDLSSIDISEQQQTEITDKIIKQILWPLRDLLEGELEEYLKTKQIETGDWSQVKVLFKPVSYSGAASEVIGRLGMYSMGKQMRTSLREIVSKFVNNEIVPSQMKETMMRLPDFGGLGFDQESADKAVKIIQDLSSQVKILSEEEYGDYLTAATQPEPRAIELGISKEDQDDEQEIATIKAAMPEKPKVLTELEKAIQIIWDSLENKPEDPYLQRRLRNVISSRLRDVRSSAELLQLLQRDTKVGGLGLNRDQADVIGSKIESLYEEHRAKIDQEEKGKIEKQMADQRRKIEERRRVEAEEHARWYKEKIKSKKQTEDDQKELAQALKQGMQQVQHPVMAKSLAQEKKELGDLVPANDVALPNAKINKQIDQSFGPKMKVVKRKPEAEVISQPQGNQVKISAITADLAKKSGTMNRVDGVTVAPRLSGLIGEVGAVSLAQFRRMGKTPQESTDKVMERLNALESESLEKKMQGVKAWQESPVMKMYLGLVAESFKTSKPMVKIAEEKRKEGQDTLTAEEIEAIIQFNNKLHY